MPADQHPRFHTLRGRGQGMQPFLQILAETIAKLGRVKRAGYFTADLDRPLEKEIVKVRSKGFESVGPLHGQPCPVFSDTCRLLPLGIVQMKR